MAATALERKRPIAFVRQKVPDRREQKRAEPSARRIRVKQIVFLDEEREETLRQVLGFGAVMTGPPNERIDRRPVLLAENAQRFTRAG